ncbi:MAG: hypothetical protein WBG86_17295, partial [Polyangiales bacterium]
QSGSLACQCRDTLLTALNSYAREATRRCDFTAFRRFESGKECVIARLDPPIPGQVFGLADDVSTVVLTHRHEGDPLSTILEFPSRPRRSTKG